jgi:hypothetical protein
MDSINRSDPAVQAKYKPYATRALLLEIASSIPGPEFDIGGLSLSTRSETQTPDYVYSCQVIETATRQLTDYYKQVGHIVNEMLAD